MLVAATANGRLAMMAITGMFLQDGLIGSAGGDWAPYTGSPLRAVESELGVQAPVGCWDPAGLSKDGDTEAFKRRRVTEIKHGRVSMWACLGDITPEYFKWPGYCSPSKGLAFAGTPNDLAAPSKVPGAGWVQTSLFCGLAKKGLFVHDPSRAPGGYEDGGALGVPNGRALPAGELKSATSKGPSLGWLRSIIHCLHCGASGLGFIRIGQGEPTPSAAGWKPPLPAGFDGEAETKKPNVGIANGRLAMVAIIGMLF